jgi:hypothetical protein
MKRYEEKSREYALLEQQSFPQQVNNALIGALNDPKRSNSRITTTANTPLYNAMEEKKSFNDVLLYLGDIQGKF